MRDYFGGRPPFFVSVRDKPSDLAQLVIVLCILSPESLNAIVYVPFIFFGRKIPQFTGACISKTNAVQKCENRLGFTALTTIVCTLTFRGDLVRGSNPHTPA